MQFWMCGSKSVMMSFFSAGSQNTVESESPSRFRGTEARIRLWIVFCLVSFSFLLGAAFPRSASAGDPRLKWYTITTKNFYIHYYEEERTVARRVAVLAEDVHRMLVPIMRWTPRRRTHVVLTDDTDAANGMAQVVPRSTVWLFVTAPDDMSTLNDYDDWLFLLFVHEYTHILHLETRGGLAKVINAVFGLGRGILYAPNHVQPRWVIEGYAVLNETIRTTGGRIRNSLYNMILRSAVLESKEPSLAELSSVMVRYPHGTAQYLYGAFFLHYLYKRFGWDALKKMSHDYGSQWIPFGLNKIAMRNFDGKGFIRLYEEWRERLMRRFRSEVKLVERRGVREGRAITRTGETAGYPVFHPKGHRVAFMESDGRSERSLKLIPPGGGEKTVITRVESGGASAFSPDGRYLLFSQMEVYRSVYTYSDLFRWDLATRRITRMTRGLRAKEPHISPDGQTAVFTVNELGRTCLASFQFSREADVVPKGREDVNILWCPEEYEQVYTPSWSPDGHSIVFSGWERGGYRNLFVYDVKNKKVEKLTDDRFLDTNPRYSPDGGWIYFSSDRTGIYNIYGYEIATGRIYQVTNVVTGAFKPALSPDGRTMVYMGFHARGYDLYSMELDPGDFLQAVPDFPARPDARRPAAPARRRRNDQDDPGSRGQSVGTEEDNSSRSETPSEYGSDDPDEVIISDRRYNPLWTLGPETWWFSAEGDKLSLLLDGRDVVGYHSWTLTAGYGVGSELFSLGAGYGYTRLWPSLHLGVSYTDRWREDWTVGDETRRFRAYDFSLNTGADFPVLRSFRWGYGSLGLRYRFSKWNCRTCLSPEVDPAQPLPAAPVFGKLGGITLGLSYSKTRAWTYSVSPEQGRSMGLSVTMYSPQLGSDYEAASFTWRWTEYFSMPWLNHHAVALRYAGGIGWGHPRYRSLFGLGGFGQQDLISALIDQTRVVGASLRGYAPSAVVGDHYYLVNMEYRFPICWLNWAPWTFPLFFRRMWGTVFVDGGHAFYGGLRTNTLKNTRWGVGGELLMDLYLGYYEGLTMRLGYAYGLNEGGGHKYYFFFGIPLS